MKEGDDRPEPQIELAGQHRVEIRRAPGSDTLELIGRDGRLVLAIEISERGPVLRFEGPALTLRASGELALEARHLTLRADESLALVSGGDLHLVAAGDLHSTARIQTITAELGDVKIEANDDVRIDGERVLVNC
ncbi:MAG TPA: hypothetical protein VGB85_23465 [Nannocystis sp.]|jgi:hypothetical protein